MVAQSLLMSNQGSFEFPLGDNHFSIKTSVQVFKNCAIRVCSSEFKFGIIFVAEPFNLNKFKYSGYGLVTMHINPY